ncbi:MAG TPA: SMP-30/gluconolactonase/LRE family protein [Gemmatimonadales bacterium]|nr:SMP-30/gluconolactonase/LRE family protein [Gemmatimonadales bacterium]
MTRSTRITRTRTLAALALLLGAAACGGERRPAGGADTLAQGDAAAPDTATRVAQVDGFQTPEAVRYDPDLDLYFVSNINGAPSAKDNNGYLSRLRPDGSVDSMRFVAGGRGGVTLHAPKGLAIVGDTVWVADIDALRAFDKRTGAPLATVEFGRQANFLNDVAVGPEGDLHVTDTGIRFDDKGTMSHPGPDRVFRVGRDRKIEVVLEGDTLQRPNGITWDQANGRFVIVPFGGATLMTWKPGDAAPTPLGTGPGMQDGVELLADGRLLVSSWADSTVFTLADGAARPVVTGVANPADIGVDTRRNRVAVPLFVANRVEIWALPAAGR